MKRTLIIFSVLFLHTWALKAQFIDSLQTSLNRKGRFAFSFNSRNSFIDNNDAHIFGFMIGVCFDRKFALGGSFNTLSPAIYRNENVDGTTVKSQLNFAFVAYYIEYLIKLTKHWEIDVPLSIGLGASSYSYALATGNTVTENKEFIMPLEPSVEVDYDFNKYWGLYVQTGYRLMLVNNNSINQNFNSPTYSFGVLLYPFEIYSGLFPKTKLAHMIEDN